MTVGIIIVTYGNRKKFLLQTILSVIHNKFCKVIVVNNHCDYDVKLFLSEKIGELNQIKIIDNIENKGSAGGVHDGMKYVLDNEPDIEYVLLLDDDNVLVDKGTLSNVLDIYSLIKENNKFMNSEFCIMCHRDYFARNLHRYIDKQNIRYPENDYLSFNIFDCFHNKPNSQIKKDQIYKIPYGFWGGLFLHKEVLFKNGLPNQKFYLYCDDVEYTLRFSLNGGTIYYVPNILIKDLEYSYGSNKVPNPLLESNSTKIYYTIRNRIYIDQHILKKKSIVYFFNKIIVITGIMFIGFFLLRRKRVRLILGAICSGTQGKLGKKFL